MLFLHPYWLFGLLAVAVPVIIHLFNFRRYRKFYFTNLRLLKSIKRETRKQHRLRHLLVLISRILAIVFLVLAFARPIIPGPEGVDRTGVNRVSIYIDNSMSMQASESGHSLLDEALARAGEVIDAYGPSDRFQLITNDFEARHQAFYNPDEARKALTEIQISSTYRTLDDVHERLRELSEGKDDKLHFFIISDFQKNTARLEQVADDTTLTVFMLPLLASAPPNVYIDSCYTASPFNHVDQQQEIVVRIVNASDMDLEKIPVRLLINGRQRALSAFDINSRGTAEVRLPFTQREAGLQTAEISIDDYPVTWDDHMFMAWEVTERIPVMSVGGTEPGFYLEQLFSNDSLFGFLHSDMRKLDYSRFAATNLVVLDDARQISSGLLMELERYTGMGGSLFIIPSESIDVEDFNLVLQRLGLGRFGNADTSRLMVTGLNTGHELFSDVFESMPRNPDLPVVFMHFPLLDYRSPGSHVIMDLQNGDPYLLARTYGKGRLYLLTSPAGDAYGNLARHALWVPLLYRMAMLSRPQDRLYYSLGTDRQIETTATLSGDMSFRMSLRDGEYEFIPGARSGPAGTTIFMHDQLRKAGFYDLRAGEQRLGTYAFNYDRQESDPAIYEPGELQEMIPGERKGMFVLDNKEKPVAQSVSELGKGRELWKACLWLALLFIVVEILLLRLFR